MSPDLGLDRYMDLKTLAAYVGLSVRTLRAHLEDVDHPLPCYRVGGKILVRKSQFDEWMQAFESRGRPSLAAAMRELGLDSA